MKTLKSFTVFAGILALIILTSSMISAEVLEIPEVYAPSSVDEDIGSFLIPFNLSYSGVQDNVTVDFTNSNITLGSINIPTIILNQNDSELLTAMINLPSGHGGETLSGTINASSSESSEENSSIATANFSIQINDLSEPEPSTSGPVELQECSDIGNLGNNLRVNIDDIRVSNGFGDDDYYWYPFDTIELDVEVRNRGDEYIDNIEINWGIYDERDEKWIIDDRESDFDLGDGDDRTETIEFKLDDARDFRDTNEVTLYVWAIGEDEEFDFNETCDSDSQQVDIINDDEFVVLDELRLSQDRVDCGDNIEITGDVWNLEDRRQRDVKVRVSIEEFDFYEEIEMGEINDYDYKDFRTDFDVPEDAEEKRYYITLEVYDRDGDIYETDERGSKSRFVVPFEVVGGCQSEEDGENIIVSANLVSGGDAGEELVIGSNIINTGDNRKTLSVNAEGHESWAELLSVSPQQITLESGDSRETTFRFNVREDVSGEKNFNIITTDENGNEFSQPVQVSINEADKGLFGLDGFEFNQNTIIVILVTLIIIVIILIIIVLVMRALSK